MTTRPLQSPERAVTAEDVERAAQIIAGEVRETPVLAAGELSRRVGGSVVMKAECLQLTGSFKVRGAFHKVSELGPDELRAGVVAASAGNHAQAVALYAARLCGKAGEGWRMTGIDPDGIELRAGGSVARLPFSGRVQTPQQARAELVRLAKTARER